MRVIIALNIIELNGLVMLRFFQVDQGLTNISVKGTPFPSTVLTAKPVSRREAGVATCRGRITPLEAASLNDNPFIRTVLMPQGSHID